MAIKHGITLHKLIWVLEMRTPHDFSEPLLCRTWQVGTPKKKDFILVNLNRGHFTELMIKKVKQPLRRHLQACSKIFTTTFWKRTWQWVWISKSRLGWIGVTSCHNNPLTLLASGKPLYNHLHPPEFLSHFLEVEERLSPWCWLAPKRLQGKTGLMRTHSLMSSSLSYNKWYMDLETWVYE
jgi:hypothetical protein